MEQSNKKEKFKYLSGEIVPFQSEIMRDFSTKTNEKCMSLGKDCTIDLDCKFIRGYLCEKPL